MKSTSLGLFLVIVFFGTLALYSMAIERPIPCLSEGRIVSPAGSGFFDGIRYQEATGTLILLFSNGYCYEYTGVPRACYLGLLRNERQGEYYNRIIRGRFPCRRIEVE